MLTVGIISATSLWTGSRNTEPAHVSPVPIEAERGFVDKLNVYVAKDVGKLARARGYRPRFGKGAKR